MNARNHQLLVCWETSPAYNTFVDSTENCALQIQSKNTALFVYHFLEYIPPTSPSPNVFSFCVLASPRHRVPESPHPWVPASPHVVESQVPKSHVPVSLLVTAWTARGSKEKETPMNNMEIGRALLEEMKRVIICWESVWKSPLTLLVPL